MRYRALLLCTIAAASCTKKNPEFCESNDECDTGFCDLSVNRCEDAPDADPFEPDAASTPDAGVPGTLVVTLSGNGAGSVVSDPAGIDCPTVCEAEFEPGATITLTASADTDSTFMGWSACEGIDTCDVTLDTGRNVSADFGVSGEHLWSKRLGGSANEFTTSVAYDSEGNVIIAGAFNGTIDLGGDLLQATDLEQDIFVAKYSPDGDHLWSKRFGGAGTDMPGEIAVDANGDVILFGTLACEFFVVCDLSPSLLFAKLAAADGEPIFNKTLTTTGAGATVAGAGVDNLGNIVIGGMWAGVLDLSGSTITNSDPEGDVQGYIARYESDGTFIRSKTFGSTNSDFLNGMAVAADGTVYLTGSLGGSFDFGGGGLPPQGGDDIFVVKLSSGDGTVWWKRFGTSDDETGRGIAFDSDGNVYVTGNVDGLSDISLGGATLTNQGGTTDMWVASYAAADGSHRWSKRFGTSGDGLFQSEAGTDVAVDERGNLTVTGRLFGPVDVGGGDLPSVGDSGDILIANYAAVDGAHRWSYAFGDDQDDTLVMDTAESVALDSVGHIAISGVYFGTINLGVEDLPAAGGSDGFLTVFVP